MSFFRPIIKRINSQTSCYSKYVSKQDNEWKPVSSLTYPPRGRMEGTADKRGRFCSYDGLLKASDDPPIDVRHTHHTTPLAKLMDDKQAQVDGAFNMMSYDPNTSMWQNIDSAKGTISPEKKEAICSGIQEFYQKRLVEDEGNLNINMNKINKSNGSLYDQISRRTSRHNMVMIRDRNGRNNSPFYEEEQVRQMHLRPPTNDYQNNNYERRLIRKNRQPYFVTSQKNSQALNYDQPDRPIDKQLYSPHKTPQTGNKRKAPEAMNITDDHAMLAFNQHDDSFYMNMMNSPHNMDDEHPQVGKSNYNNVNCISQQECTNDNGQNFHNRCPNNKTSSAQFNEREEAAVSGHYAPTSPPEPMFKPSGDM